MSEGIGGVTVALQVSGETRTGETMPGVSVQIRPDPFLINSLHPVSGDAWFGTLYAFFRTMRGDVDSIDDCE